MHNYKTSTWVLTNRLSNKYSRCSLAASKTDLNPSQNTHRKKGFIESTSSPTIKEREREISLSISPGRLTPCANARRAIENFG